MLEKT
jgi:hypothetical protein